MAASGIPDFDIRINGAALAQPVRADVRAVTVEEDVDALSMFTVELHNWDDRTRQVSWSDSPLFAVGNEVAISLGYLGALAEVMVAEITSLEPSFTAERPPSLTVRGYDHRHRMARARRTRSFSGMKDSAIAAQLAGEAGLRARVEDTEVVLAHVVQSNQTDLELLRRRADLIGYEVFVQDKVLHFQPPQNAGRAVLTLSLDADVTELSARLSAVAQVGEVTVRGWDVKEKRAIVGRAGVGQEGTAMGGDASGPRTADRAFGEASVATVSQPVQSKAEADRIAQGRFDERALTYVTGDVTCGGRPQLRAGTVVEIEGAGRTFSGAYYVTSVTHELAPTAGYRTILRVRRNAA